MPPAARNLRREPDGVVSRVAAGLADAQPCVHPCPHPWDGWTGLDSGFGCLFGFKYVLQCSSGNSCRTSTGKRLSPTVPGKKHRDSSMGTRSIATGVHAGVEQPSRRQPKPGELRRPMVDAEVLKRFDLCQIRADDLVPRQLTRRQRLPPLREGNGLTKARCRRQATDAGPTRPPQWRRWGRSFQTAPVGWR